MTINHADFWARLAPAILEAVATAGSVTITGFTDSGGEIVGGVSIRFDCTSAGREWWWVTVEHTGFGCAPEPAAPAAAA